MPLKIYQELAVWWPLWSPPEDYREEATFFAQVLKEAAPGARTMVEFGSGGGSNAFYLKAHYTLTLVDISPEMLAVSRAINPDCEHLVGDMRSARLGRQFDLVFIHDAIDYMTTEADLRQAFETAFAHCQPGGAALFVPDHVRETFKAITEHDARDSEDGRALRVLEWQYDPDPTDSIAKETFALACPASFCGVAPSR
ncbi:MAG: methyltransferase domain-containing protein [Chloroflexota bacterium]